MFRVFSYLILQFEKVICSVKEFLEVFGERLFFSLEISIHTQKEFLKTSFHFVYFRKCFAQNLVIYCIYAADNYDPVGLIKLIFFFL